MTAHYLDPREYEPDVPKCRTCGATLCYQEEVERGTCDNVCQAVRDSETEESAEWIDPMIDYLRAKGLTDKDDAQEFFRLLFKELTLEEPPEPFHLQNARPLAKASPRHERKQVAK